MSDSFWSEWRKKQGLEWKQPSAEHFWGDRSRMLLEPGSKDALVIGQDLKTNTDVRLDFQALRTHLQIVGPPDMGKSKTMELLARQLMPDHGLSVIDPKGHLYEDLVNYIAHFPRLAERTIFFNPTQVSPPFWPGYNPLTRTSYFPDLAVQVEYIVSAVAKVWEEDPKRTPTLQRVMGNMLYPLIEGGYTFLEARFFTRLLNPTPRTKLVQLTSYEDVREDWDDFEGALSYARKKDDIGSLHNRLTRFIRNHAVRMVLGRTENVLDMADIFENQKILLVNLSGMNNRLEEKDRYTLGTLLISEMVRYARTRSEEVGKRKPFFLFVDEIQNLITPDVAGILDECRGYGLHLIMAHQRLGQLERKNPDLLDAVMGSVRSRIVFGDADWDTLERLEKRAYVGEHDLREPKDEIHRTATVGHEKKKTKSSTSGESYTSSYSSTQASSRASAEGRFAGGASGAATRFSPDLGLFLEHREETGLVETTGSSEGASSTSLKGASSAEGSGEGFGDFNAETESEVYVPVLDQELASRTFYNLEEQRYRNIVRMSKQPKQHATIKILQEPPREVKIRTVESFPRDEEAIERAYQISYQHQAEYYLPEEQITRAIEERQRPFLEKRSEKPVQPETFRVPRKKRGNKSLEKDKP